MTVFEKHRDALDMQLLLEHFAVVVRGGEQQVHILPAALFFAARGRPLPPRVRPSKHTAGIQRGLPDEVELDVVRVADDGNSRRQREPPKKGRREKNRVEGLC